MNAGGPTPDADIRLIEADDEEAFLRFAAQVSGGEHRFLKEDLADPAAAFVGFLAETHARRLVAVSADGAIVGMAGAFPGEGWSSHVAEIRLLVSAPTRGRGIGRSLARAALLQALRLGCSQAYVEVVSEQGALVTMFQDMGFEPEALLADFVRDSEGEFHDLLLLTHRTDTQWARNRLLGLDEVVA